MTQSQQHLVDEYWAANIDFKMLVTGLFDLGGLRPRECYAIAVEQERLYMQAIAKRSWEKATS